MHINSGSAWNASPAWTPDQQGIVFSSGRMDATHLARVRTADLSRTERLAPFGEYGWQPTLGRTPGGRVQMVYTEHFESVNIWRQRLDGGQPAVPLISSPHWSYEPDYAPDGKRIVFISDRTGSPEVWVSDEDGRNPRQWTFLNQQSLGSPRWSPDGARIAFSAPGPDGSSIFLIDAAAATPSPVRDSHRCGYLSWARDGNSIYFSSNRGGSTEIWNVDLAKGAALQVTRTGGRVPAMSTDGKFLYYLRTNRDGASRLYRAPVNEADAEEEVLQFVEAYAPMRDGVGFKIASSEESVGR